MTDGQRAVNEGPSLTVTVSQQCLPTGHLVIGAVLSSGWQQRNGQGPQQPELTRPESALPGPSLPHTAAQEGLQVRATKEEP